MNTIAIKLTNVEVGRAKKLQEEKGQRERKLRENNQEQTQAASLGSLSQKCVTNHRPENQTGNLAPII